MYANFRLIFLRKEVKNLLKVDSLYYTINLEDSNKALAWILIYSLAKKRTLGLKRIPLKYTIKKIDLL